MTTLLYFLLISWLGPALLVFVGMAVQDYRDGMQIGNRYLGAVWVALAWPYTLYRAFAPVPR